VEDSTQLIQQTLEKDLISKWGEICSACFHFGGDVDGVDVDVENLRNGRMTNNDYYRDGHPRHQGREKSDLGTLFELFHLLIGYDYS